MKSEKIKQHRDPLRRQTILDAALLVFTQVGYADATLAMICKESGSSVGSVYHFFSNKAEIAYELIRVAIGGWAQESGSAAVTPQNPESSIKASVRGLLIWAGRNEALFRFMEEMRAKAGTSPEFVLFNEVFLEGQSKAAKLYGNWSDLGIVRKISWPVAYSLMMGPAYLYLRTKPHGQSIRQNEVDSLVQAAWNSVRAGE